MSVNKYRNIPTEVAGIMFDSRKEARRYSVLLLLERGHKISNLQRQVSYELIPAIYRDEVVHLKTKDKTVQKCVQKAVHYIADFVYTDNETGETVVEDTKGVRTKEYKLKKKMMLAFKGINIKEV